MKQKLQIPRDELADLHIDGDIVVYRAAWAAENASPTAARKACDNVIAKIAKDHGVHPLDAKIWLTEPKKQYNYRFYLAKTNEYKLTRGNRPKHYQAVRNWLESYYSAQTIIGLEADDVLGWVKNAGCTIATVDKDLKMVPGLQYDIIKGTTEKHTELGEVVWIEKQYTSGKKKILEFSGFKGFCVQLLTGDTSDSIPGILHNGIRGVRSNKSPTYAYNLLNKVETVLECWDLIRREYKEAGCMDRFEEQVKLLWMQRYPGNDYPTLEQVGL